MNKNNVPMDVLYHIASFLVPVQYKLRDDIPPEKLDRCQLILNPRAFRYVMNNFLIAVPWDACCRSASNDAVVHLRQFPMFIHWQSLCLNPNDAAVDLLLENQDQIEWKYACSNPNERMVDLLLKKLNTMVWNVEWWMKWHRIALNPNDRVVSYMLDKQLISTFLPMYWKNQNERMIAYLWDHERVDWTFLSQNPSDTAMDILAHHIAQIDWVSAQTNTNDQMVDYLIRHTERILPQFSGNANPRVLPFLLSHPEHINWYYLSSHPDLFVRDDKATRIEIRSFVGAFL